MSYFYVKTEKDHVAAIRKQMEEGNEIVIFKNLTVFSTPSPGHETNKDVVVSFAKIVLKKSVNFELGPLKGNNKGNWTCKLEGSPHLSIYFPDECFSGKMIHASHKYEAIGRENLTKDAEELEVIYFSP